MSQQYQNERKLYMAAIQRHDHKCQQVLSAQPGFPIHISTITGPNSL
jgi:hypothetical protein